MKSKNVSALGKGEVDSSILSGSTIKTPLISTSYIISPGSYLGNKKKNAKRTQTLPAWKSGGI